MPRQDTVTTKTLHVNYHIKMVITVVQILTWGINRILNK